MKKLLISFLAIVLLIPFNLLSPSAYAEDVHIRPVTTASLSPSPTTLGTDLAVYPNPTTVIFQATADTGYTIDNIYYKVDRGVQQTYSTPFNISTSGTHTFEYWSVDNVGVPEAPNTKTFTIANHNPVIGTITATTDPQPVGTTITASSSFTDPDTIDTHIATWTWGDGTLSNATVTESNGSGTVQDTHIYSQAGVYTVTLTVYDNDGASGTSQYQYVVVYDPSAGFLTVGGNYDSQEGWDLQDANASGKVILGISAMYRQNNTVPTGNAKVMFKVGDIDFTATSYQWLVVNSSKAYLMGNGTINGSGSYQIFISVIDENQVGGQDLIRVQLRDTSTQNIIYDTQPGDSTIADPITILSAGSIKVH